MTVSVTSAAKPQKTRSIRKAMLRQRTEKNEWLESPHTRLWGLVQRRAPIRPSCFRRPQCCAAHQCRRRADSELCKASEERRHGKRARFIRALGLMY